MAFALAQQRVFVTRDRGILAAAGEGVSHAGIAIARAGRGVIGPNVHALTYLHRTTAAENMTGRAEYL